MACVQHPHHYGREQHVGGGPEEALVAVLVKADLQEVDSIEVDWAKVG
jgi:hypothetical protein